MVVVFLDLCCLFLLPHTVPVGCCVEDAAQVLRVICSDAHLIRFLYDAFDSKGTTVVRDMVVVLARHVHSAVQLGEGMEEILEHVARLYTQKAKGA